MQKRILEPLNYLVAQYIKQKPTLKTNLKKA